MDTYEMKYKNALEWARQVMNGETGFIRREVEEVFPELKESEEESEDVKIRRAILDYLTILWGNSQDDICGVNVEDAIAWLEKQGEKSQIDGFDAELNALLKKYEHLPKEEIWGCLNFYVLVLGKEMEEQQ